LTFTELFINFYINISYSYNYHYFKLSIYPLFKEDSMTRKKGKPVSFDAMVKFFMQSYNIPTKKDMNKLMDRLDRL